MLPVVWPAAGFCAATDVSAGVAGATVIEALVGLSGPVQLRSSGAMV